MIPGLDIHLYSKKFRSRLRLENFTSSKTRLFQHFVCYMCVTKEHIILSYKSLFVSFWAIPHITSIPIRLYYTPTPVYISFILLFSHALFYDIIIMLSNRYPATGGGEVYMENLAISFLVSFMASIAAYYVCKWLDGDK